MLYPQAVNFLCVPTKVEQHLIGSCTQGLSLTLRLQVDDLDILFNPNFP